MFSHACQWGHAGNLIMVCKCEPEQAPTKTWLCVLSITQLRAWVHWRSTDTQFSPLPSLYLYTTHVINYSRPYVTIPYCKRQKAGWGYIKCRKCRKMQNVQNVLNLNLYKCATKINYQNVQLIMYRIICLHGHMHTKPRQVKAAVVWKSFLLRCFIAGWRDSKFWCWWCGVTVVTEKHRTLGITVQIINRHFRISR